MIKNLLFVATGGALGAMARYFIGIIFHKLQISLFLATFSVNITGSFLIGFLTSLLISGNELKLLLITGFLGSFTTYSTFMLDNVVHFENKKFLLMILNSFIQLLLGFVFAKAGINLGKLK